MISTSGEQRALAGSAGQQVIRLRSDSDVDGFRTAARALLAGAVHPAQVSWHVATAAEADLFGFPGRGPDDTATVAPPLVHDLFADSSGEVNSAQGSPEPMKAATCSADGDTVPSVVSAVPGRITVPAFFIPLCERTGLHSDPGRFGLLYRLLWRLVHEPTLRHDPLDADRMQADLMARAVRRDMHKMTAFVRFRPIALPVEVEGAGGISHVAWFEPGHHIVEATAPFFARRFAQMRWAILTPERSVRWDGHTLAFGPGARRADAPSADANERLWLTYYENIFNPARLKMKMMQKEMPRRYWKNLPEAALIQPLIASSAERSGRMVETSGSEPARRRPAASQVLRIAPHGADTDAPTTLAALRAATERCRACPIGQFATQAVNGEGPAHARLIVVGEQAGDQEDLRGRPFIGPAGKLFDRALEKLGWPRDALYVTNAVKHFKYELRGKRRMHKTPTQREVEACLHWLDSEIALVQPQAAIALGATAARALLGRPIAVMRQRGQWLQREDGLRVLVTLHPSALLRMVGGDSEAEFAGWVEDLAHASGYAGKTVDTAS